MLEYAWHWPWPLKWTKVKYKCISRKPMYDLPFTINSNLYHIACETIIYELSKYCQLQYLTLNRSSRSWGITSLITHWMSNWFACKYIKKMAVQSQTLFVSSTNELYKRTFYRLPMLNIGKILFLTLTISMKVTILNVEITKAHNGCQTKNKESLRASIWRPVCRKRSQTKIKKRLSTISKHQAVRLLIDQRPLVFDL